MYKLTVQERLSALEECCQLGQGFQLAEKGMGIRGFEQFFVNNRQEMLEMLGSISSLKCFLRVYPRYFMTKASFYIFLSNH